LRINLHIFKDYALELKNESPRKGKNIAEPSDSFILRYILDLAEMTDIIVLQSLQFLFKMVVVYHIVSIKNVVLNIR
jgi:hypothetical protein